jgi:hypothetical protein
MFVLGWTGFIIGVWYSREQYWEELKYRERGEGAPLEILPTLVYMFVPARKNMDFILPVVIAVVMAAAFVLLIRQGAQEAQKQPRDAESR